MDGLMKSLDWVRLMQWSLLCIIGFRSSVLLPFLVQADQLPLVAQLWK